MVNVSENSPADSSMVDTVFESENKNKGEVNDESSASIEKLGRFGSMC